MFRCVTRVGASHIAQAVMLAGILLCVSGSPDPALAQSTLLVPADEARVVPLVKSPATIVVGNPSVADVSVQNGNLLVVMGKNYGTTNIIALDGAGEEIASIALNVTAGGNQEVSLHLGSQRVTLNCAPNCEQELNVGDAAAQFEKVQKQISAKTGLSDRSAAKSPEGE